MKYIDAEKLYKQVDELMAHFAELGKEIEPDDKDLSIFYHGKKKMCSELLGVINSLQQEQPIGEEYTIEVGKHTHTLRVGSQSDIDNLIRQEKQEQPEVDLDKLVDEEFASHSRTTEYGLEVTYNRAELYQLIKRMALIFNARKED